MRFKFRAWDKEVKDMREVTLMDWSDWWVSTGNTWQRERVLGEYGERNSFNNEETDRHIIMQYTGLKDRNGKEIYESDIVESYRENYIVRFGVCPDTGITCFYLESLVPGDVTYELGSKSNVEVIGNVHEHPHLLQHQEGAR